MTPAATLTRSLGTHKSLAVAVSGGIDSTLLAHMAHQVLGAGFRAVHAVSPAVPAAATQRVRAHAATAGWQLDLVDAGEFDDPRYRENPLNRCYFCKRSLYGTLAALADGPVASGTNCDDLGDFRPGLTAAAEQGVVHPYVEAGLGKRDIYALARDMGLSDLAALPAQPCLASRIETGLRVEAADLSFIEAAEAALHAAFGTSAVLRCRLTHLGVVVELADLTQAAEAERLIRAHCAAAGRPFLGLRAYKRGAAFLHEATA